MRRILTFLGLIFLILLGIGAWLVFASGTAFKEDEKVLYISSKAVTKDAVLDSLNKNALILSPAVFDFIANRVDYWSNIRPGRYVFKRGMNVLKMVRMLKNGQQDPVKFTLVKVRLLKDFAGMAGRKMEFDSTAMMNFLTSEDSLKEFGVTPELVMTRIVPDSYTYYWTASPRAFFSKFNKAYNDFWNDKRKQEAAALGLTPDQVVTLASIVEQETTIKEEKDTVAAVYLNRLRKNDKLRADPTVIYAEGDFTIRRVAGEMLNNPSPFNTYYHTGLPPAPICTPSKETIEETLHPANTNYYFFAARPNLRGHVFAVTFEEHNRNAAAYRQGQFGNDRDSSQTNGN